MIKRIIKKWLGIDLLERKMIATNHDIMTIIEKQLIQEKKYPVHDPMVVPTTEQSEKLNKEINNGK